MATLSAGGQQDAACMHIRELTMNACKVAHSAAGAVAEGIATGVNALLETVRPREIELDRLDREIDSAVTTHITGATEESAREMLACMKLSIGMERIGDLLLGFSNRALVAASRCEMEDVRDLTLMASRLEKMLSEVREAFEMRNLDKALAVLRSDAEIDRLRNLVFVRHLENPGGTHRSESFHVVFMTQALERAGDHVKNMAEEVCHLVSGQSVRHLLRSIDKPLEQMFLDQLRTKHAL
ncbi:phosphate uptake regulator, PhoU [Candidatus Koribacter versatilis Ellin345]|uniref:Phosphate uptake regulator, PhoU n=1 Tax=Koribacter versatilis (strain Ellin345) TaxID=204669 RepID=Q1IMC3_KORVE|nr:PhoU domain-containing protein [Candidatus Koribacter versatilis]ABF41977.1 phosphate uptake regulator, PhoU [Candidatus Koribacter versatilis Ellin345]